MVFNGLPHLVAQAIVAGVIAAHDALQLWEFAHHVGQQIDLGQASGGVHVGGQIRPSQRGHQALGDGANTLGAIALRAQLAVVNHLGQACDACIQGLLAVLVKEELGIGQAWPHHAFVTANDGAGVCGTDVAHDQKLIRQLA